MTEQGECYTDTVEPVCYDSESLIDPTSCVVMDTPWQLLNWTASMSTFWSQQSQELDAKTLPIKKIVSKNFEKTYIVTWQKWRLFTILCMMRNGWVSIESRQKNALNVLFYRYHRNLQWRSVYGCILAVSFNEKLLKELIEKEETGDLVLFLQKLDCWHAHARMRCHVLWQFTSICTGLF